VIRILIDADFILETLMNRNEFAEDFKELLDRVHPSIQMYLTDVGWEKIYAYTTRLKNSKIAEIVVDWLQEKIQICAVDQTILYKARSLPLNDFETAVELVCVSHHQLDAIVTHKQADLADLQNKFWVWSIADLWLRVNLESQLQASVSI
jgi:predicted nucleic acid-binding protein